MASVWGQIAQDRLSLIAKASTTQVGVTRMPYSDEHRQALKVIESWLNSAGLEASLDDAGTLVGRLEGQASAKKYIALGSHQDSVRCGGRYDGIMGIALACLAIEKLQSDDSFVPTFGIEVYAFADEEGVRFPTSLVGSRAIAGTVNPEVLDLRDKEGASLREALTSFGCDPSQIGAVKRSADEIKGYLEVHIEQGPILETENQALGVVTGICGIERHAVEFAGETGHAGTLPMHARRDALVAASELVLQVNQKANQLPNIRATIGTLSVSPGAVNQVPGHVSLTVEIRSAEDIERAEFGVWLAKIANEIARKTACQSKCEMTYAQDAQQCNSDLQDVIANACIEVQGFAPRLVSGATHDASAMADICPIGMLFVRCREGKSHTPDEFCSDEDMGKAIDALAAAIKRLTL